MRLRTRAILTAALAVATPAAVSAAPTSCRVVVVEGEVRNGQSFQAPMLAGVDLQMEPLPSGWELRVEPAAHHGQNWAEMATPPYRSVTPLRITTEYSFRSQDAIGWNPRRFRFAANQASFARLQSLRRAAEAGQTDKLGALAELASRQPEGVLEILDAHLVPGTADQARAAGLVATHFATTAHTLDQPANGRPTPLGIVTRIRFRVSLRIPNGARAAVGSKVERRRGCGGE